MNPKIDNYLEEGCGRCSLVGTPECKVHRWPAELKRLRQLLLDCGLTEELKWSMPCYTHNGKNIVMLSAFKDYCALGFFKGTLLKDSQHLLQAPGENSQSMRMFRFTDINQIEAAPDLIKAYVFEAIEIEKAGLKPDKTKSSDFELPVELLLKFDEMPLLKTAFEALTTGRQRGYALFFTAPKQAATRTSRIEKFLPQIFAGKGLHDK